MAIGLQKDSVQGGGSNRASDLILDSLAVGGEASRARTQHQRKARRAGSDREPVGPFHLSGGQNFHAEFLTQPPYHEASRHRPGPVRPTTAHVFSHLPIL